MGRIHRVGQQREVHLYNLVATDTREGETLLRLLDNFVTAANDAVAAWTHDKELAVQRAEQLLGDTPHRSVWFRPADHDLHAQFPDRLAELLDAATNEEFFR